MPFPVFGVGFSSKFKFKFRRRTAETPQSLSQFSNPIATAKTPVQNPDDPVLPPSSATVTSEEEKQGTGKGIDVGKLPEATFAEAIDNADQKVQSYKNSNYTKILNATGTAMHTVQAGLDTAKDFVKTIQPAYQSDEMQAFRDRISKVAVDSMPGLLKALDALAKLHPFISIAVVPFSVVIKLDMKRRDNDKKIELLLKKMGTLMKGFLRLGEIEPNVERSGKTIAVQMQGLFENIEKDIKECGNACDVYARMNRLTKVLKSPVWDETFTTFIKVFVDYQQEFAVELSTHTGVRIDDANQKLDEIKVTLLEFSKAISSELQELAARVEKKGGPSAVMEDNEALKELLKFKSAATTGQAKHESGQDGTVVGVTEHNSHEDGDDLEIVKQELFDSPEVAIKKNMEVFERKFKMQQRELEEEMRRMVRHEGDRVIKAVTSGPHDKIIDPDIHKIWEDMRWTGHVKAHQFVLALRDYYCGGIEWKPKATDGYDVASPVSIEDEWTLRWISVSRLRAIAEAFDDDASGFITIAEVNRFTVSRPKEWSLPHWLAYWAIGWQMTATKYRDMIVDICAKMFAIRSHIHPANRNAVDKYLQTVWKRISTLTSSFVNTYQTDSLQERFKSYVEAEEERLREGLKTVQYDIDAMDTLLLVTGPGRIEKHLFPLLWLLLRRDFEIFRLCRNSVIHKDELWDSADTIIWVFDAITQRHNDLQALFKQQKLDPGPQFKVFASELYDYWHNSKKFWSLDNLRTLEFLEVEYDDAKEDQNVDLSELLNYPSPIRDLYPQREEDSSSIPDNDAAADEAVRKILGRWNGLQTKDTGMFLPMVTLCLHASRDNKTYEASSVSAQGTTYNIHGEYATKDDGTVEYSLVQAHVARFRKMYWTFTLEDDGETLTGKWGYAKDNKPGMFVFKRVPPEVLINRPHPKEFTENRIKALWKYALTATHSQVRRRLFSWSYIKERRDVRKEYLELLLKEADVRRLTDEDMVRLSELNQHSTFDDVRCFYVLHDYGERAVPWAHFMIWCDHCGEPIHGTRMVCMECGTQFTFDFCDKPACVGCTIKTRDDITAPHLPTHDFIKVRAPILHYREIGKVLRTAKDGLERAKNLLEKEKDRKRSELAENREESKEGEEKKPNGADKDSEVIRGVEDSDAGESGEGSQNGEDAPASQGQVSLPEKKVAPARREAMASSDSESEDEAIALACLRCERPISQPCLYCIDCPEDSKAFICWDCDEKEAGFSHGQHHLATHNLVRCMEPQKEAEATPEEDTTEKRLGAVEHKLEGLTSQMERIEKLLQSLAVARAQ